MWGWGRVKPWKGFTNLYWVMRLSVVQRESIKTQFADELGTDCEVMLFGSRTSDLGRGGDVDLLVRTPKPVARKVWVAARLAARAERLLDGRKVDVVLLDSNTALQPIHAAALATGVAL